MNARSSFGWSKVFSILTLLIAALADNGQAEEAEWIWSSSHSKTNVPRTACYFRKAFSLSKPEKGQIAIVADDEYELYINGRRVGSGNNSKKLTSYDVTRFLSSGRNTIAVKVTNTSGKTAALAARVQVKQQQAEWVTYSTDMTWRTNLRPLPLWNTTVYNDRRWPSSQSFGLLGETAPWDRKEAVAKSAVHRSERFRISEEFQVERLIGGKETGSLIAMSFNEFGHAIVSKEGGPLLLLYDANRDGRLDKARVYCDKVKNCQGILCLNGDVFVTAEGDEGQALYRLQDTDRDGTLETVKAIVKFKTESQEHGAHGLVLGPDGLIYVVVGNHATIVGDFDETSPHRNYYEGDLLRPKYEDPGGHAVGIKVPGGTIIRTDISGKAVQLVAGGLRNAYDLAFNREGEMFVHDSDMESDDGSTWYRPTSLFHVTPGAEFGWRSGWSKWADHYVDVRPPLIETGRGSPTGAVVYDHYMFPQRFHNAMFLADWSEGRILAVRMKRQGASYVANSEVFLEGSPLNVTDLEVGPDGALYFITGGRGTNGGMYRVKWRGEVPDTILNLGSGVAAVIRQPQLHSAWARQQIARIKSKLGDDWEKMLIGVARSDENPWYYRTRALDVLQLYGPAPSADVLTTLAESKNESVRAKAADLMGLNSDEATKLPLFKLLNDSERIVRRKACEALLRAGHEVPVKALIRSLASDDRAEAWAARRLLERLPGDSWKDLMLKSDDHRIFIQGALALMISQPSRENAYDVLEQTSKLLTKFVSDRDFVDLLRVIEVTLQRSDLKVEVLKTLRSQLADEFPSSNSTMNRELAKILVYLQSEETLKRFLTYLDSSMPIKERVHVALMLRYLKKGWTGEQRLKLLRFYETASQQKGGGSYSLYVMHVSRDFARTLDAKDAKAILADGSKFPNAVLAALGKLPPKLDKTMLKNIKKIDTEIHGKDDDEYKRLRVGIVAILARSGDDESMKYLRRIWSLDPERRPTVAMGLAQQPKGANWPYLVRSLRIVEGIPAREVLRKLHTVGQRPQASKYYRDVILCGLKLKDKGADDAVKLLEHWTGEAAGPEDGDWSAKLKAWQAWYAAEYPNEPAAELPKLTKGKWNFDELLEYIESDDGLKGSKQAGRQLFVKAQCAKCHRLGEMGEAIGPNLSNLKKRFMRKEVLESILYPSHVISDQYVSKLILTKSGKTYKGMVAAGRQGQRIVLQADGQKIRLDEDEIVETRTSKISSMPEGLLDTLTQEQIADLFAFLDVMPQRNIASGKKTTTKR